MKSSGDELSDKEAKAYARNQDRILTDALRTLRKARGLLSESDLVGKATVGYVEQALKDVLLAVEDL